MVKRVSYRLRAKSKMLSKSRRGMRKATKPSASIYRAVKAVLNKDALKKYASTTATITSFNSAITSAAELYPMLPDISQGSGGNQRSGEKIKANFLKINGIVKITTTSTLPEPKYAFIYFLEDKTQKDYAGGSTPDFLNDNGTPTQFNGGFGTACMPVDTTRFRLLKRLRVRLTQNRIYSGDATQTSSIDNNGNLYKYFNVKIPMKGRELRYNSNGATTQPENCNMFWACGYTNFTGTVDVALTNVQVQVVKMLYYRD